VDFLKLHELTQKQLLRSGFSKDSEYSPEFEAFVVEVDSSNIGNAKKELALKEEIAEVVEVAAAKEKFLANMSHEIRTPMNGVLVASQLLLTEQLEPEILDNVQIIERSAKSLLSIINDILDFSKLKDGKFAIERIPVDLERVFEDIDRLFSMQASVKNLFFRCQYPVIKSKLMGDPVRIRQILINLIGNGLKFTAQGEVALVTSIVPVSETRMKVKMEVRDTGCGLPESKLETIFEEFSQADETVGRKFGGTGLGLSISKNLSKLMGGDIVVRSVLHSGSVFSFVLEMDCATAEDLEKVKPEVSENVELWKGSPRVLLVDDNMINLKVGGKFLSKYPLTIENALDGRQACEKVFENRYDLILMDIHMPVMDGITAAVKIQEHFPLGDGPSLVAMTASALEDERLEYKEAGFDGVILKPFSKQEMLRVLNTHLA
jgi:signal transduction histidine kinase/CheY-like chemotaxis protein